ncbi:aminoglycoside phosphotransferase family protein [Streptomyces sp. P17]|uniref:aminoglycoside phosphotransferase family protein n=1 Tax=Streptomyces sp. P17 TaxID=3074716 RepID=UPI0028F3EE16|nr:aminoglycoside phosphotransferase family protein [Streptomyces sp. P17]MDT9698762.1 aminoglycoside phosphotransferase family protein [Streptomyces sp. P17]
MGERAVSQTIWSFVLRATQQGRPTRGHHNQNYVLPVTDDVAHALGLDSETPVTVRMRRTDALPVVIRTWQDEAAILDAVNGVLPSPKCLYRAREFSIHSYVEGVPLSSVCGNGKPLDTLLVKALADLLARATEVPRRAMPALPGCWPRDDRDSRGFLRTLAHLADQQIRQPNWDAFGGLFAALGIPQEALTRFAERVPAMIRRPYSFLHTDLHRENLIMSYAGDPPLICVDLELATYGDPLHDLATHLVRSRYPAHQWDEVIDAWAAAMERMRPAAVDGLAKDLRHYVAFERAQSVYPDVMRAAESLRDSSDQKSLDEATARVHEALTAAAGPLELRNLPGEPEIEGILFRWREARADGSPLRNKRLVWMSDSRVPERPDFPHSAVRKALHAEGAAPASRVFKGTGHLNSVIEVSGVGFPVVVRRKVANICRRERGYLSEHAVLGVIEESRCEVSAPRALALGRSYQGEPFAIHTYAGPPLSSGLPPEHPVDGLRPHEADCLVDQLRALTKVDYTKVDPTAGHVPFYTWLSEQLVELVGELPRESQQFARLLGLPDGPRLGQILARHQVRERKPALLHGDLNPWNLVRRGDGPPLTIIDWEMAVVGDPLYDLVRHIHLTPTRSEIRERMQQRWVRLLEPEYTAHWRADWRAYRRIEIMRSAYIDLDRLVTGASLDAPNVRRAVDAYAMTLATATGSLGLRTRLTANPFLARALA